MLDFIYITSMRKGKQKSLAYALGLAKAFSNQLFILPTHRLDDPQSGKILIWKPEEPKNRDQAILSEFGRSINYRIKKQNLPIFFLGRFNPKVNPDPLEYEIARQIMSLGFPIFILPFNCPYQKIRKVLFTGNAPGLPGHPLKNQIAATFLPKAFKLEQSEIKRIHWSNICFLPECNWLKTPFSCKYLTSTIQDHNIDLVVLPFNNMPDSNCSAASRVFQEMLCGKTPTLLIPSSTKEMMLYEVEQGHSHPLVYN